MYAEQKVSQSVPYVTANVNGYMEVLTPYTAYIMIVVVYIS